MSGQAISRYWGFHLQRVPVQGNRPRRAVVELVRPSSRDRRSPHTTGPVSGSRRSIVWRYAIALFLVGLALAFTLLLERFFRYPFLFLFFGAVMASSWFAGTAPGLFAVLVSTLAIDYFFVSPYHSLAVNATDSAYFAAFIACALVASWVSSSAKETENALKDARDQLEARVAERTSELEKSNAELRASIEEQEKTQQALMNTQAELAHLSRVLTMGELTSSIAHEVHQPLTAVVTYGHACLEWLSSDPPNLKEARQAVRTIIQDATRAGEVLNRIRASFKKEAPAKDWLDMNEVIRGLMVFVRDEASRNRVTIRTELAADLPKASADRIQLEQVVINLVLNAIDAVRASQDRRKEIVISSQKESPSEILIAVQDCGVGLDPEIAEKIFDPFFTTKPRGIGMGLSISRSIVESHGGRLWATPRLSGGTVFQFTVPVGW